MGGECCCSNFRLSFFLAVGFVSDGCLIAVERAVVFRLRAVVRTPKVLLVRGVLICVAFSLEEMYREGGGERG